MHIRKKAIFSLFLSCLLSPFVWAEFDEEILLKKEKLLGTYQVVEVIINKRSTIKTETVYINKKGEFLVPEEFFPSCNIKEKYIEKGKTTLEGSAYINLQMLDKIHIQFDKKSMELHVEMPVKAFETCSRKAKKTKKIDINGEYAHCVKNIPYSNYLNYSLSLAHQESKGNHQSSINFLPELVSSTPYGFLRNSFLLKSDRKTNEMIRLTSYWGIDDVDNLTRWRFGDARTQDTSWGGGIHFSGVQLSKGFNMDPGFIPYPQPSIKGSAATTTSIDILSRNVKLYEEDLPPGEFSVDQLPVVAGPGNLTVETTDLTGNKHTVTVSYYISPRSLKKGVSDYSFSLGMARKDFGRKSNNYENAVFSGNYSYGITDYLTGKTTFQTLSKGLSVGSIGGVVPIKLLGASGVTLNSSIAASHLQGNTYYLTSYGADFRTLETTVGFRLTRNDKKFTNIATYPKSYASKKSIRSVVNQSFGLYGTISASYTDIKRSKKDHTKFAQLNYTKQVGRSSLNFNVTRLIGKETVYGIFLNIPLGDDMYSNTRVSHKKRITGSTEIQKTVKDYGIGYKVRGKYDDPNAASGEIFIKDQKMDFLGQANYTSLVSNYRANITGSIVQDGSDIFFTQRIFDGYGVVNTNKNKDVSVYRENHFIGKTSENGKLVIPTIISYIPTKVSIKTDDLSTNSSISATELSVISKFSSGVEIDFDIKNVHRLLLSVYSEGEKTLPKGTHGNINEKEVIVGNDGTIYLEIEDSVKKLEGVMNLEGDKKCSISYSVDPTLYQNVEEGDVINIGKIMCK